MTVLSDESSAKALTSQLEAAAAAPQGSSSSTTVGVQLCAATLQGHAAVLTAVQQQAQVARSSGQTNLAALLHLASGDVLCSADVYRSAGCPREALAVASAGLLPCDPAARQLRQQYAAAITPAGPPHDPGTDNDGPTPAAAAAAASGKPHAEAAAANLLLLDEPAAAARALAARDGGCNPVALHAAARVAALAAVHKDGLQQQELSQLAAQCALHACLLLGAGGSSSSSSGQVALNPQQQQQQQQCQLASQLMQDVLQLLQPLACSSPAAAVVVLTLSLAAHLHTLVCAHAAAAAADGNAASNGRPLPLNALRGGQLLAAMLLLDRALHEQRQQQQAEGHADGLLAALLPLLQQLPPAAPLRLQRCSLPALPVAAVPPPPPPQQQQQADAAAPAAACCAAAVQLWHVLLASLGADAAADAAGDKVQAAWDQHMLPALLAAARQQQQQEERRGSSADMTAAAAAAPVLLHPRVAGQRQRFSNAQLYALSKSPLLLQLQQLPQQHQHLRAARLSSYQDLRQLLAALNVPLVSTPEQVAGIAASIEYLLPGHMPVPAGTLPKRSKQQRGQQQQQGSQQHQQQPQSQQ